MTAMAHWLIRLHGDEDWGTWGNDWMDKVDKLAELHHVDGTLGPPDWLRPRPSVELDWGSFLYDVSLDEVRRLLREPGLDHLREGWQRQLELLDSLDPSDRYGAVWIEEGGEQLGPGEPAGGRHRVRFRYDDVPFEHHDPVPGLEMSSEEYRKQTQKLMDEAEIVGPDDGREQADGPRPGS